MVRFSIMKQILITATLLWASMVCASIRLTTGPGTDRVGQVTGLLVNLGSEGYALEEGTAIPSRVLLDKVELMTRDTMANYEKQKVPYFLKVYEDPARTVYVGCSVNALSWDIGGGVYQVYEFNALPLNATKTYYFAFETASDSKTAPGSAGFRVTAPFKHGSAADASSRILVGKDLSDSPRYPISAVSRITVRPATDLASAAAATPAKPAAPVGSASEAGSSVAQSGPTTSSGFPWILFVPIVLIAAGAGAFFLLRKKTPAAPGRPLPPPPGQDR